ncbi:hypothetical protein GCM10027284_25300 [Cyclobacterium sediminis]
MISIVIPVFNCQNTLERAVLSVLNDPIVSDILIIDDGSTDNSLEISHKLSKNYPLIRVLNHPNGEKKGACASRNLGLANAKSDWIQFLDADDELLKGKLSGQFKLIKPDVAFIVGNCIHILGNGKKHLINSNTDIWIGLIRSKLGRTSSILWNKKFLNLVNGWNENLSSSQEYDLMFRILVLNPNVSFDKRYLTLIHKEKNSISTKFESKYDRIQNWLHLREEILFYLKSTNSYTLPSKYYLSGAVGVFCEENNFSYPHYMNILFFKVYKFELIVKSYIFNLFKYSKSGK